MIPKIIHYCWISDESQMSQKVKDCIASWHKYLPDYKFINWNDSNFDWNVCEFARYCRDRNLYAFCADFIRYWAIYNYGGIYLDSDVLVFKSFDELLNMKRIITRELPVPDRIEAAIMGGEKGDLLFKVLTEFYMTTDMRPLDTWCSVTPDIIRGILAARNFKIKEITDTAEEDKSETCVNVLDNKKFFDMNNSNSNTFATHLFTGSWLHNPRHLHKWVDNWSERIFKHYEKLNT